MQRRKENDTTIRVVGDKLEVAWECGKQAQCQLFKRSEEEGNRLSPSTAC